ncbi:PLP-dependent aminotransferase family protein [Nocardioides gansuensis]|uniref:PLP-dependent aminotransferase family protein n=1 Tax=Nocardioides gansuensis TaxID=2138300 RepID=A0A2T8F6Z1_9ACTN|nr:PLP-dependent aminotransferase family protein [Nocardioides gansuensis]PVG81481.1 PLP-dependent aminotransferase family protein [Nocardioides gansuensis]
MPALPVLLDRSEARPLGTQLADQVRRLVLDGGLAPGTRLPSTRRLAAELGVSRAVIEQAWDQLRAEGWLEARQGSGSWVAGGPITGAAAPRPRRTPAAARPLVPLDAGTPWIDTRHAAAWRRAWREVSAAAPPRGYDDPQGLPELRTLLAERLGRTRGLVVDPGDVLVTAGTSAGLRHLLAALPRGPVAIEDPGYRAAVLTVRETGREVRDLPALEPVTDLGDCSAAYVTPAHQHPLGRVMPADDRLTLLATARRDGALVVEDDYDSEFRYDVAPVPALSTLDPDTVAYLGTASKSVLPSLRLGWMVVPPHLREAVDRHRLVTHDAPPWPVQRAMVALLRDGYVDAVVRSARRTYADRAPRVVAALSPYAELAGPVAGMYSTWLLPHATAVRACAAAEAAGFRVNLLGDYCRTARLTGLVVGFGGATDEQLDEALRVLAGSLAGG